MNKLLPGILILIFNFHFLIAQDISGSWYTKFILEKDTIYANIDIFKTATGLSGKIDRPAENIFRLPMDSVSFNKSQLTWMIQGAKMKFEGLINKKEDQIKGSFYQDQKEIKEVIWFRKPVVERSQEIAKKLPYSVEEIIVKNEKANISLSGTLTIPKGKKKHPVVILISGSGAQNRDEEILGHKPFHVLADYLSRNGIAVLRYDDRGTAKSTGVYETATTAEFADDANVFVDYLKKHKRINPQQIGLVGHSEGGMIAPMLAAQSNDIAYIITLAGMGVPNLDFYLTSLDLDLKAYGLEGKDYDRYFDFYQEVYTLMAKTNDKTDLKASLNKLYNEWLKTAPEEDFEHQDKSTFKEQEIASYTSDWYHYFLQFDVTKYYQKLQIPVLALNGNKDIQVDAKQNLDGIRKVLEKNGNKRFKTVTLENVNHFFQTCKECSWKEIYFNPETFSPVALKEIKDWIQKISSKS